MKVIAPILAILTAGTLAAQTDPPPKATYASWYGEELRGKLMANGKKFDPDKMTAASWFYPIGTRVRVTLAANHPGQPARSVVVTITDRGPAKHLVRDGRIIDLAHAAFEKLAPDRLGLIPIAVSPTAELK